MIADRLRRLIEAHGPISVAQYMAEANAHYYATRDPLGAAGDFTTAPEISQMFGELVGLCLADAWVRAGSPAKAVYVELGPGRGTLAADALRAMGKTGLRPAVHLVETSPVLRKAQGERVPNACWHDDVSTLPSGVPLLVVANEFFDALPVRQLVSSGKDWRERMVTWERGSFTPVAGPTVPSGLMPAELRVAPTGAIVEVSPASAAVVWQIAHLLRPSGGVALLIDYGHARTSVGDTLQAVARHGFKDPWVNPGEQDLTAHVDFQALGDAARAEGVRVLGAVEQGAWLRSLGIEQRAAALSRAAPERAEEIGAARDRLIATDKMGTLFRAMALAAPNWPDPAGFA